MSMNPRIGTSTLIIYAHTHLQICILIYKKKSLILVFLLPLQHLNMVQEIFCQLLNFQNFVYHYILFLFSVQRTFCFLIFITLQFLFSCAVYSRQTQTDETSKAEVLLRREKGYGVQSDHSVSKNSTWSLQPIRVEYCN